MGDVSVGACCCFSPPPVHPSTLSPSPNPLPSFFKVTLHLLSPYSPQHHGLLPSAFYCSLYGWFLIYSSRPFFLASHIALLCFSSYSFTFPVSFLSLPIPSFLCCPRTPQTIPFPTLYLILFLSILPHFS